MHAISLEELSKTKFTIQYYGARSPLYKEHTLYHHAREPKRTYTGLMYLSNCDMSTTSLNTNTQYNFSKGSLILLPQNSSYYSIFTNTEKTDHSFICLNMLLYFFDFNNLIVENEPTLLFEKTPDIVVELFRSMLLPKKSYSFFISQLHMIWDIIFENSNANNKIIENDPNPIFTPMDIKNKSNKELAAQLNISVSTLTRMFKKYYNTTPSAYALQLKLSEARYKLLNTDMSVSQISSSLEFNSLDHFGRIFKKHMGISPSKYRSIYTKKNKNL